MKLFKLFNSYSKNKFMKQIQISNEDIVLLGDIHGSWQKINFFLEDNNYSNLNIIQVGDFGIGYDKKDVELNRLTSLSEVLKSYNAKLYVIRGNHDDPAYFQGKNSFSFENIIFVEDYTVLSNEKQNILCIGGAVSIDRLYSQGASKRINRPLWWKDEIFVFDLGRLNAILEVVDIDVVITHTAPKDFHPTQFGNLVYQYAQDDHLLLQDLENERWKVQQILERLRSDGTKLPKKWFYGHFHESKSELFDSLEARLLGINEFKLLEL
jgi:predicted phosphodiesterase